MNGFSDPTVPNLPDFTVFVYNQGVPQGDLPSTSPYLQWAYAQAVATVIPAPPALAPILYVLAVYNLGMHLLLTFATDTSTYIVSSINITNNGSGYGSNAPNITFSAALNGGLTAQATAVLTAGEVTSAPITVSGSYPNQAAPSVTFAPPISGTTAQGTATLTLQNYTYFADAQTKYKLLSFTTGPVVSTGDQNTNVTLLAAEWMKDMTLDALEDIKTPWGKRYLQYAQAYGPTVVGIS